MSDFMQWLYDHYINSHIKNHPMDDGDQMRISLVTGDHTEDQMKDLEIVLRYYACQGFLLGLRTGAGLAAQEVGRT